MPDIKMSQNAGNLIVNELSRTDPSEYKTLGELAVALKSLFALIGLEIAVPSDEDRLTAENEALKAEVEKLKNPDPVDESDTSDK